MDKIMLTCRILKDTTLVVRTTKFSFAGSYTKHSLVHVKKDVDFQIEDFEEFEYYYDIFVYNGAKNILDGGFHEYLINIPKDLITIANKHKKFKYVNTSGCIEGSLPICPQCHDTRFVKDVQGSTTKCIPNPPTRHICEKCEIQWDVRCTQSSYSYKLGR